MEALLYAQAAPHGAGRRGGVALAPGRSCSSTARERCPLGAFLSGGIDSSAVVAYMAQEMAAPVRTFAVGFEESAFDERRFARIVAERYGTDHTELIVKAPVTDILPRLVWHYDEPFGDASAVPSYAIAALTRQYVTVVLNGDGGDENFAGYDRYFMHRLICHGDKVPRQVWRTVAALIRCLPAGWHHRALYKRLAKAVELLAQVPERRYVRWFGLCTPRNVTICTPQPFVPP